MRPEPVAVILAAGASRRFGATDKRLARLPSGRTLLAATLATASVVFPRLRVVLREDDDPVALGLAPDTPILRAPRAADGLGASLADAFASLAADPALAEAPAAAVLLGDMPNIAPATLVSLSDRAAPGRIVRPRHAGRPGHPVLFGRDFWAELAALDGDEGARRVIAHHRDCSHEIGVDDPGIHLDVDAPDDLAALWHEGDD
ncbi:nucleotidyltransferase family protein [Halomonas salina]|uniref:Molybdopterin-guanine dinucleotide biosynthesis protein MobA n=1 Tax=Halomonas salina TaxID=42565 RepID=A0ABR4WU92_9GAMM|nr:nucleotidyltransferase family protein [Halomonas salina]KGE78173.1 molybdopterin-guanine dinucleotide biosynthesis protein MobA [Halomonas salina]